jgi:hypothetical protein
MCGAIECSTLFAWRVSPRVVRVLRFVQFAVQPICQTNSGRLSGLQRVPCNSTESQSTSVLCSTLFHLLVRAVNELTATFSLEYLNRSDARHDRSETHCGFEERPVPRRRAVVNLDPVVSGNACRPGQAIPQKQKIVELPFPIHWPPKTVVQTLVPTIRPQLTAGSQSFPTFFQTTDLSASKACGFPQLRRLWRATNLADAVCRGKPSALSPRLGDFAVKKTGRGTILLLTHTA